jgi:hypothetical protein
MMSLASVLGFGIWSSLIEGQHSCVNAILTHPNPSETPRTPRARVAQYPLSGAKKQIHQVGAMMPRDITILLSLRAYAPRPAHQGQSHSAAGTAHPGVPNSPAG